ncbi:hypothetical protein C2H96_19515 [Bacillus subtilis]|uniref:DUF5677 domain-containing protein n=1 Tax=Bacillus subtilis TaxID=1423 RepID=UPI00201CCE5A|nr:DUF5677 domain-containing protein [Bacillus subtilis]UQZ56519.1 hypothetical protein C2H96_19515 [Bacillus subtilis]UQZ65105.1 hypothetical protein C2H97_00790 [Bacillus subtilis PY79]UQZ69529.1 hypothetical protein C2I05_02765 [Bacillus subtilis]
MDKKKHSKTIHDYLNSPEYKEGIIEGLLELSDKVVQGISYVDGFKERALNLLYIDAQKSFKSFILLAEQRHINSSVLFMRKIIEIFIRMEYLSVKNQFENYCRAQSNDQAKILSSLLSSRPIKSVEQTALWRKRHEIISECKKIYQDKINKKYMEMPNLDIMAAETGLYVLYIEKYSPLSKFVHSNISVENFYMYKDKEGLHYSKEADEVINNEGRLQTMLNDTMFCFYKITQRYIQEMGVQQEKIKKFEEEFFIFTSFDLITGTSRTNVDISQSIVNNLLGKDLPQDKEDQKHEVLFVENDLNSLRHDWKNLEIVVKQKENELKK